MKKLLLFAVIYLIGNSVFAGGYGVALQSQKFLGMAHAGTGLYLDGSAIYFNPAALSQQQKQWAFTFGVNPLFSTGYYKHPTTGEETKTDNPTGTPAEFYASYRINENFTAGLGFYTPFGNSVKWPSGWDGAALITDIKLKTCIFQPTLSYKVNNWLNIGAGLVVATADVNLKKEIPQMQGGVELDGHSKAKFGYNLGIYIQPNEKWSIGIDYRSKVKIGTEDGNATFNVPAPILAHTGLQAADNFNVSLPLVSSINIGAAYRFNTKWTLAADVNFNNWSEYEELFFEFEHNKLLNKPQARDYKNTITARLGVQYKASEKFTARAGVYYDPTPVRKNLFSPETPSMNNLGITCGGSYQATECLGIDFSMLIIKGFERHVGYESINFWGDFRSFAFSPGIGLTYSF